MDIRNYISFNTVVELGGFSKAAHKLSYAQSTITLHIQEMEKHYDVPLFDRMNKKVFLTHFGKKLYQHTKVLVSEYQQTLSLDPKNDVKEVIRIGVYESLLKYRLYELIVNFKKSHPNVDMIIHHGTCVKLRQMVKSGDLDLSFQIEDQRAFTDLTTKTLCQEKFSIIVPKGESLSYIDAPDRLVYFTEKDCSYRYLFENYLDSRHVIKQQIMETGSVDLIKQYVALGLGYSMVPSVSLTKNEISTLTVLPMVSNTILYTQLFHHKDKSIFPAMRDFMDLVAEYSKDWY